nr:paraquat-inducible protein A [uncultured Desulfobulbus sp.]
MVCPSCSKILSLPKLQQGQRALCPRCARQLRRHTNHSLQKGLALSITGLVFFLPANLLPLLTFSILGIHSQSSILQSCLHMFSNSQLVVGSVVALTTIVFPLLLLVSLLLVTFGLLQGSKNPYLTPLFRIYHHLSEWAMLDVFLVGVLITIIKMSHMASVSLNGGFFCLVGLVVTTVAAQNAIDPQRFWKLMETKTSARISVPLSSIPEDYLLCSSCYKLLPAAYQQTSSHRGCPRCGHTLHPRKQNSIARTWALLLTAVILTLPANLLPIMEVDTFGIPERSTILDGIIYFFQDGSYGIGLVIFIASILVPLFKIIGLAIILLSIHFRWRSWLRHKAIMFRFIEFIGRWSMLDIFVITLLCSLAQFGFLSSISAAPASLYFTGVVLSTMLAALSFDPRLLWDAAQAAESK